jgi:hypothetical protein
MKRRDFLSCSTGSVLLATLPCAAVAAARGSLLDDPQAWLGTAFRTATGATLELAEVEQLAGDAYSQQVRLRFRTVSGVAPPEGTHLLASGWSRESLFLQNGREGSVACVNRLRALA